MIILEIIFKGNLDVTSNLLIEECSYLKPFKYIVDNSFNLLFSLQQQEIIWHL